MSEPEVAPPMAGERRQQSHARNGPLFLVIGGVNVLVSLLTFGALTSLSWSPLRGREMLAYLVVTVPVSLLAAFLWDRVVWRVNTHPRVVALSLVALWSLSALSGLVVQLLVGATGWNAFLLAVVLTPPTTAANYFVQASLRRQTED